MLRSAVLGVTLSIVVGLLVRFTPLGMDTVPAVVLGACLGAVLGMNVDREPWQRVLAFGTGVAVTWVSYAARAEVLPDAPNGRAIAAFAVLLLVTGVAVGTAGRLPLWAGLLGVGALVGSYEFSFTDQPEAFGSESLVALTTLAFATSAGYALTVVLAEFLPGRVALPGRHVVDVRESSAGAPEQELHPTRPQPVEETEPRQAMRGPRVIDLPRDRRSEL